MEQILSVARGLDGVLELAPGPGSEFPEIAWGDHFFYYAPDGRVPERQQPYATIVTKDYPGDTSSDLDRPGRWRLNVHVGRTAFARLVDAVAPDPATADTVLAHPVYARQGWVSIVEPGERTAALAADLLRDAHEAARRRAS
ncbi:DUF6194 family protein [Pseudonocardia pini]|uniref:DUF6194 family protein n=1 Tax=Pseudonocardia pini TaxID=2758030 RepID=UPI0015F0602B|nr:DUF6194 family protein [Pseudonocardia pini]